jgi:hypothetical protein
MVPKAPAPVIARSLNFHDKTITCPPAEAGGTWKHHAAPESREHSTRTGHSVPLGRGELAIERQRLFGVRRALARLTTM